MRTQPLIAVVLCLVAACGGSDKAVEEFTTTPLKLPNGVTVRVEVMTRPEDMMRGMMFRESLPEGRGMLFIHGTPGLYPYWMHQVKIPLDIIWMDKNRSIVEIVPNAPPCPFTGQEAQQRCPNFGGHQQAIYVLELPAGSVAKHNLQFGARLEF